MMQPPGARAGISHTSAFFMLAGLLMTGSLIGSTVSYALWPILTGQPASSFQTGISDPVFVNQIRFLQTSGTFMAFFLPALATARMLDHRPLHWLGYNRWANPRVMAMAALLMALCIPVVGMLTDLNKMIPVPAHLEAVFQSMEEVYERQINAMTRMNGWPDFLISLLVMALGPAIFEETFFRGGLQRILHGMMGRTWAPVIITAIIFSAIHFSYFGFIPRFVLGLVLGLLYQFSGSLWTSILAHFVNNAAVVTVIFIYVRNGMPVKEAMEADTPLWISIPAIGVAVFLFTRYRTMAAASRKQRMDPVDKAWEERWLA